MASVSTETSTVSGRDTHTNGVTRRAVNATANGNVNGNYADGDVVQTTKEEVNTPPEAPKKLRIHHKYRHVAAIHSRPKTSCLSRDSEISPSFVGFRNLMVIVLVVGNLRLMLENYKKYGVLICIRCHDYRRQDLFLGIALFLSIPCHLFIAYIIELVAAKQASRQEVSSRARRAFRSGTDTPTPTTEEKNKFNTTWKLVAWLHTLNSTFCLGLTSYIVYYHIHHPLIGTTAEVHAIIVWLKTASYAFTNRDLRHAYLHPSSRIEDLVPEIYASCPYPKNITLDNLCYFWWAPTLIYQPVYPRTERVRWTYISKRALEVLFLSVFMWAMSAQYAAPVLKNSLHTLQTLSPMGITERIMKLSTISLVVWLAGFFALFQSFLNALAEITKFADRDFYEDWWNSPSVGAYWRTWNKPVYQFMRRHVFSPLIGRGWSAWSASVAVFTLSAVLHELLVGVPTHNVIGVAALGMWAQLPLIKLTNRMERLAKQGGKRGRFATTVGNGIFWVSFVLIGQPLAALIYFFAWHAKVGSVSKL